MICRLNGEIKGCNNLRSFLLILTQVSYLSLKYYIQDGSIIFPGCSAVMPKFPGSLLKNLSFNRAKTENQNCLQLVNGFLTA